MFDSCVVKLTSICNLDCSYCYMFNLADRTYERVPNYMSTDVAHALLDRINAYLCRSEKNRFKLTLHGGEPALWPLDHFRAVLPHLDELQSRYHIDVGLQTNALQLDEEFLDLMRAHDISVGVSLDGPREYNDQNRVDHAGDGSYQRVIENVEEALAAGYGDVIEGFLAVAQPDIPPSDFLDWVRALPKPKVDVLWPIDYDHDRPPWDGEDFDGYREAPRYGEWFASLFDQWWTADDPEVHIRLFYHVIERMMGAKGHIDAIGNDVLNMFVVNTDGQIEYPDYFRGFTDGGSRTSYNIQSTELWSLAEDDLFARLLDLRTHRSSTCSRCPFVDECGGGFLPGRMGNDEIDLRRRSVMCPDEYHFFARVYNRLTDALDIDDQVTPTMPFSNPISKGDSAAMEMHTQRSP